MIKIDYLILNLQKFKMNRKNNIHYDIYTILDEQNMEKEEFLELEQKNLIKNYKTLRSYFNPDKYMIKKLDAQANLNLLDKLYSENKFDDLRNMINQTVYKFPCKYKEKYDNFYLTLKDLYQRSITVDQYCSKCKGHGKKNILPCLKCEGQKDLTFVVFNRFNMTIKHTVCDECEGQGEIAIGDDCNECESKGIIKKVIKDLPIPKDDLKWFQFDNITIHFRNYDDNFVKQDLNLIYTKKISLKEMIYGFQFNINLFDTKTITISSQDKKIYNPKEYYSIPNLGFKNNEEIGKLLIKFEIDYPSTIYELENEEIKKNERMDEIYYI